jgi:Rab GDP dissociation inhibitor
MNTNDDYLSQSAIKTISKLKIYLNSLYKYSDYPYIYPVFGIAGIHESFLRISAIHGATFLMKTHPEIVFGINGKVEGIHYNTKT